jgi:hypothetical protein
MMAVTNTEHPPAAATVLGMTIQPRPAADRCVYCGNYFAGCDSFPFQVQVAGLDLGGV